MDTNVCILAKIAISGLAGRLLRRHMAFVGPSAEDHTRPVATAAKPLAIAMALALFARNLAKSVAITQSAASCAMSLAYHVLRVVPGLVHIADDVHYHVQCRVICYHAQSAVQRY